LFGLPVSQALQLYIIFLPDVVDQRIALLTCNKLAARPEIALGLIRIRIHLERRVVEQGECLVAIQVIGQVRGHLSQPASRADAGWDAASEQGIPGGLGLEFAFADLDRLCVAPVDRARIGIQGQHQRQFLRLVQAQLAVGKRHARQADQCGLEDQLLVGRGDAATHLRFQDAERLAFANGHGQEDLVDAGRGHGRDVRKPRRTGAGYGCRRGDLGSEGRACGRGGCCGFSGRPASRCGRCCRLAVGHQLLHLLPGEWSAQVAHRPAGLEHHRPILIDVVQQEYPALQR